MVRGYAGDIEKKFENGYGISHIIARRNFEGHDGKQFALNLAEVFADGNLSDKYGSPGGERVNIIKNGIKVVLSLYEHAKERIWILTGFDMNIKPPNATSGDYDPTSTTHSITTRTHYGEGAGIDNNIAQSREDFNSREELYQEKEHDSWYPIYFTSREDLAAAGEASRSRRIIESSEPFDEEIETLRSSIPSVNHPLGTTPVPLHEGELLGEVCDKHIHPVLDEKRNQAKTQLNNRDLMGGMRLDDNAQVELRRDLNQVRQDMASTKLAVMRSGESIRDMALLNYNQRYGFDNFLGLVFPYQFWYTRTVANWALRLIDKPAWFAFYATNVKH